MHNWLMYLYILFGIVGCELCNWQSPPFVLWRLQRNKFFTWPRFWNWNIFANIIYVFCQIPTNIVSNSLPDTINISSKFKFSEANSNIASILNDSFENSFQFHMTLCDIISFCTLNPRASPYSLVKENLTLNWRKYVFLRIPNLSFQGHT